jgi:arylsulfatase A-like enzyme
VDPHATYNPPGEYAAPFFDDQFYDPTPLRLNQDDNNFDSGVAGRYWRRNGEQRERGWYIANYDGEVRFTDAEVGRLLDLLDEQGLLSTSVVVFTADHGESLGEHNYYFEHGWYPYNASAWIPFVVYWPDVPEPGRRVTYPVGLIHLVPTIVDLMGWELSEAIPFHGRSLIRVLRGEEDRVDDYVVVEAGEGGLQRHEFLRSIEDARWKLLHIPSEQYQRGMQGMAYELYEVRSDPMETTNVVDQHPELVSLLRTLLEQRLSSSEPAQMVPAQLPDYSQEEIENLRSLGYIR